MIEVRMQKERETKNTWRYMEIVENDDEVVGTIYVQKRHLNKLPTNDIIVVTIKGSHEEG